MQIQAVERLQKAHFAEEANIFDHNTLVCLAGEIGLDETSVDAMLAGDQFKKDVEADHNALQQMGVSGVPFFLIDGEHAFRGVQSPDVFLAALQKAWAAKKKVAAPLDIEGMICGTDQCDF